MNSISYVLPTHAPNITLLEAICSGRIDDVKNFLQIGVEPKGLPLAVKLKNFEVVKCLLEYGCELFEIDEENHTCFYYLEDSSDFISLFIPVLLENLKLTPLLKDENLSEVIASYIIPILMAIKAGGISDTEFLQNAFKTMVIALSALASPGLIVKFAFDHAFWDGIDVVLPWLTIILPQEHHILKKIIVGISALKAVKKISFVDFSKSCRYFKGNHGLSGSLYFLSCTIRTIMAASPFIGTSMNKVGEGNNPLLSHETCFNYPNTSTIENLNNETKECEVIFYSYDDHGSLGLKCKETFDKVIGFYPEKIYIPISSRVENRYFPIPIFISKLGLGKILSIPLYFFTPSHGKIIDESIFHPNYVNEIKKNSDKLIVKVSVRQMKFLNAYITEFSQSCSEKKWNCRFLPFGSNCIDFLQSIFKKLSYHGHFIDYISDSKSFFPEKYARVQSFMLKKYALGFFQDMQDYYNLPFLLYTKSNCIDTIRCKVWSILKSWNN